MICISVIDEINTPIAINAAPYRKNPSIVTYASLNETVPNIERINGYAHMIITGIAKERFSAMTGIGRLFPKIYEETVKKMRSGKYGDECKKFFKEHPDGAVNCEKELLICEECGVPKTEMNLSLYLPKEGAKNIPEMSNVAAIKMQPITDEKYDFNSLL